MKSPILALAAVALIAAGASPALAAGSCTEQLKSFTASWNSASPAHKTTEASKHYAAALAAQKAKNDKECASQLRKASDAMK